jgi:hypothetical protein
MGDRFAPALAQNEFVLKLRTANPSPPRSPCTCCGTMRSARPRTAPRGVACRPPGSVACSTTCTRTWPTSLACVNWRMWCSGARTTSRRASSRAPAAAAARDGPAVAGRDASLPGGDQLPAGLFEPGPLHHDVSQAGRHHLGRLSAGALTDRSSGHQRAYSSWPRGHRPPVPALPLRRRSWSLQGAARDPHASMQKHCDRTV